jgi:hypothetical protein
MALAYRALVAGAWRLEQSAFQDAAKKTKMQYKGISVPATIPIPSPGAAWCYVNGPPRAPHPAREADIPVN